MKHPISTRIAALGLCLLVGCAPATQLSDPTGGLVGPVDENALLGVWAYEVNGSCFLLQGRLIITKEQGGLSVRLNEIPFAANEGPDSMQRLRNQQRCAGIRAAPANIVMDEVSFDGEMLIFAGASTGELGTPFRVNGRLKGGPDALDGTLAIDGRVGGLGRNEAASMSATRDDEGFRQRHEAGTR